MVEAFGYGTLDDHTALCAKLDHEGRLRHGPDGTQGFEGIGRAAGNVDFFFGADNHVHMAQHFLQVAGHRLAGDEPGLTIALVGKPPEHGPVVEIDDPCRVVSGCEFQRVQAGCLGAGGGKVRAGCDHCAGRGDQRLVDVVDGDGHVGAVFAVEDQRKADLIADAEQDKGGQAVGVCPHGRGVDALALQLFTDEAAHGIVADPGDQGRVQAEPRGTDGGVGGAAADVFGEASHILQAAADLLAIEVYARTADHHGVNSLHHGLHPSPAQSLRN